MLNFPFDPSTITAVRLGDGWHQDVTNFRFFGDGRSEFITVTGATWREGDQEFACPLQWLLAVRTGNSVTLTGRPDAKFREAVRWLEQALQDGCAHEVRCLRENAKMEIGISAETLDRAYNQIPGHAKPFKEGKRWFWRWEPLDAEDDFLTSSVRVSEE